MDIRPRARRALAGGAILTALAVLFPGSAGALPATDSDAQVNLNCKIVPGAGDYGYLLWRVQLRKPGGEVVRHEIKAGGDKIRLKNLKPGIYMLCIAGEKRREHCESLDLTPPSGRRSFQFVKDLTTPRAALNQVESFQIRAHSLSVPQQARDEMLRSETAEIRGDSVGALKHLERALSVFPDYPEALNNLGVRLHRKKDYKQAIRNLRRATELDPDLYPAWINLGGSLMANGEFPAALEAHEHAYKLRPDDPLANSQLALNYFYMHDYEEATKYFKQLRALDPQSATAPQLFLAHIALLQKNRSEAQEYIRDYLQQHPNSPQAAHLQRTLNNLRVMEPETPIALDLTAGP